MKSIERGVELIINSIWDAAWIYKADIDFQKIITLKNGRKWEKFISVFLISNFPFFFDQTFKLIESVRMEKYMWQNHVFEKGEVLHKYSFYIQHEFRSSSEDHLLKIVIHSVSAQKDAPIHVE